MILGIDSVISSAHLIVGVDPGLTGGLVVIDDNAMGNRSCVVEFLHMPIQDKVYGKGSQVDAYALSMWISQFDRDVTIVCERQSARPGQGVTAVFGFGRSTGVLEGICAAMDLSITWVTPQRWKKAAGLTGKAKDAARTLAQELYPEMREALKRKKDIGLADAVLLGATAVKSELRLYCQSRIGGQPAPDCLRYIHLPPGVMPKKYRRGPFSGLQYLEGWRIEGDHSTCPRCCYFERIEGLKSGKLRREPKE